MSSDDNGTPDTPAGSGPGGAAPSGPRPEPLRFFGTTWVDHGDGYTARRIGVAVGSLALAAASCVVFSLAYDGIRIADTGGFVNVLVVAMFAICSVLAFRHTWDGFARRPDAERHANLRGLLAIGFVGSLLAYFFRALTEAPGERLHRQEYEAAVEQYGRRTARRTGNPSKKRRER
ncbi:MULTISPECIES: EamA/RhaT family transporter [unclassified Streptomyces]|uniref:EamA/RhaT family transporter n=1 Tax=unclassified Streptomyces TaxID=2593676 RepID=UPI001F03A632|nr:MULTISPECIES: EamA/RhaT family transporter [unclassified Streptomyces]MCH0565166.1 EamA/RhaT family transporter [Streptomyces sp. MUM 2J]MCH0571251.1 EamA/RhaT family transporter [Streptomyces sp. MUM 136J]